MGIENLSYVDRLKDENLNKQYRRDEVYTIRIIREIDRIGIRKFHFFFHFFSKRGGWGFGKENKI